VPAVMVINKAYCYAELVVLFPSGDQACNCNRQSSLRLPMERCQAELALVAELNTKTVYPRAVTHRSSNRARCKATTLIDTNAVPIAPIKSSPQYIVSRGTHNSYISISGICSRTVVPSFVFICVLLLSEIKKSGIRCKTFGQHCSRILDSNAVQFVIY